MRRALLPAAALVFVLAACNVAVPFDVAREVALTGPAGDATWNETVDLSQEDAVWSRRDALKDLSVSTVSVTVKSVGSTNQASAVRFSLALRPDSAPTDGSADVVIAKDAELSLTPGAQVEVPGTSAIDGLILSTVKGSGRFALVASAAAGGPVDARVEVEIAGSISVDVREAM